MPLQTNEPKTNPAGSPHAVPWFFRLFGLYNKQAHSFDFEADQANDDANSKQTADDWARLFKLSADRRERYRIFDEMDASGLAGSILDLYTEETTQIDYDKGKSIWVESGNPKMVKAGEECLRNLMAEDKTAAVVRYMMKYGDEFRRIIYQTGKGVLGWQHARAETVHRIDDKFGRLVGFREDGKQFRGNRKRIVSWPWDYAHFRLLGKDEDTGYGTSVYDPMFNPWRRFMLSDDAVLMYRLRRSPDRNVVMVDVGNMEEHEAIDYVNTWRKRFRKHEFIDPASPNYRKQYNPLTPLEDIFMPVKGSENNSRVEALSGAGNADQLLDLNYYRDAFFGSAKVPKAFMGFEGDVNAKATLLQQDVRFARTCKRIRKHTLYGYRQVLDTHFTLLPTDANDRSWDFSQSQNSYVIQMSPISYLDEFARLELIQLRYQIVEAMANLAATMQIDVRVWATYILLEYAKLPEDLVMKLISQTQSGPVSPGQAPAGAEDGSPVDDLPAEARRRISGPLWAQLTEGIGRRGFYNVSEKEQFQIARMMHESSALRKVVGDIAEFHIDDLAERQTDASLLPVLCHGAILEDDVTNDPHAKDLKEDLLSLQPKKE